MPNVFSDVQFPKTATDKLRFGALGHIFQFTHCQEPLHVTTPNTHKEDNKPDTEPFYGEPRWGVPLPNDANMFFYDGYTYTCIEFSAPVERLAMYLIDWPINHAYDITPARVFSGMEGIAKTTNEQGNTDTWRATDGNGIFVFDSPISKIEFSGAPNPTLPASNHPMYAIAQLEKLIYKMNPRVLFDQYKAEGLFSPEHLSIIDPMLPVIGQPHVNGRLTYYSSLLRDQGVLTQAQFDKLSASLS